VSPEVGLFMLPESIGYDLRKTFHSEDHHEEYLKSQQCAKEITTKKI
jgi:hypothetical protein